MIRQWLYRGALNTQWEVFGSRDLNEYVEIVNEYINYCVDTIIPTKTLTVYPNDKPWVSKELKILINKKRKAYTVKNYTLD